MDPAWSSSVDSPENEVSGVVPKAGEVREGATGSSRFVGGVLTGAPPEHTQGPGATNPGRGPRGRDRLVRFGREDIDGRRAEPYRGPERTQRVAGGEQVAAVGREDRGITERRARPIRPARSQRGGR